MKRETWTSTFHISHFTFHVLFLPLNTDLAILSRLRFVTRARRHGGTWGERRSTRRGIGLEFADYRDYTPGDDPRRVDWNLYARLDRPYVRVYEEEENLAVYVLLDGSASMEWGEETVARWPAAQHLAIALGALALLGGDTLRGALLHTGKTVSPPSWGVGRGRGQLPQWEAWVMTQMPSGATELGTALQVYAAQPLRPGLILLLTDGYDPLGVAQGLAALAGCGHEVVLLHLLTPDELAPDLRGDLRLVDVETGDKREITLDRSLLDAYQHRLSAWQSELRALAGRHGGRYVLLRTDLPLHTLLLDTLRQADVLR
ncbi:MAG: DUF58 domain-containing protein [Anaerolineae bacterium]|nr:DUF58 domain-containing protein [Anaerolineae bacterium]